VNIDEGNDENVWRDWIKSIKKTAICARTRFGVITMLANDARMNSYLLDGGIECGYIVVKIGAARTTEILLKMLEANEARGRRRYVRAGCPAGSAEMICKENHDLVRASILDISIVGMAAVFIEGPVPQQGSRLKEMQLNLKGARIIINGVIIGGREDPLGGSIRAIMFEPESMNDDKRHKLRTFIGKLLQGRMNEALR
jgi:hypothetical protein